MFPRILATLTVLLAVVWAFALGVSLPIRECAGLGLATAGLMLVYRYTKHKPFKDALIGLLCIVWFSSAFVLLTYEAATVNRPMIDEFLSRYDLNLQGWNDTTFGKFLSLCYDTMLLQTAGVVCLFNRNLDKFILRMMIGGYIVLVCFVLWPARGPFLDPSWQQQLYLDHLSTIRAGNPFLTLSHAQGLITFPSFHAVWALLLTDAFRNRAITILNALIIVSTLTTGWHYGIDTLAGIGLALLLIKI